MEYIFDAFLLWTGRFVFVGAILIALALLGTGVAKIYHFLIKKMQTYASDSFASFAHYPSSAFSLSFSCCQHEISHFFCWYLPKPDSSSANSKLLTNHIYLQKLQP